MDEDIDDSIYDFYVQSYNALKSIQHNVTNAEERLRILNAMITTASSQSDKKVMIGSELIQDFIIHEANELQEVLVYNHEYSCTLNRLVEMINESIPMYIDSRNDYSNQKLRVLYKEHGLHNMYKYDKVEVYLEKEVCLFCCDMCVRQFTE